MADTHERRGEEYDERPTAPRERQHGEGVQAEHSARHDAEHGDLTGAHHGPVDLAPSADRLMHLIPRIEDSQLDLPTPCAGRTVSQLLGHLVGLTRAFRAAAEKDLGPWTDSNPDENGWARAADDWREALAERVPPMVTAWFPAEAWEGRTRAGGVDLPGAVAGLVALGELTFHGWDLARATGHDYRCDEPTVAALERHVAGFDPAGTPGVFGPALTVADDADRFARLLAAAGRDSHWERRSAPQAS